MILTRNMFIYFSCYFDIDQGHSDRFKWCIANGSQSRETDSGSGLKRDMKNRIFWSEIGSGFENRAAHPRPKFLGVSPPSGWEQLNRTVLLNTRRGTEVLTI